MDWTETVVAIVRSCESINAYKIGIMVISVIAADSVLILSIEVTSFGAVFCIASLVFSSCNSATVFCCKLPTIWLNECL